MADFTEALKASGEYSLADVRLELTDDLAIFHARLCGPVNTKVWARAWISDDSQTLSEAATDELTAGDIISLAVTIPSNLLSDGTGVAAMRIESAPLQTEHVLTKPLRFQHGRLLEPD